MRISCAVPGNKKKSPTTQHKQHSRRTAPFTTPQSTFTAHTTIQNTTDSYCPHCNGISAPIRVRVVLHAPHGCLQKTVLPQLCGKSCASQCLPFLRAHSVWVTVKLPPIRVYFSASVCTSIGVSFLLASGWCVCKQPWGVPKIWTGSNVAHLRLTSSIFEASSAALATFSNGGGSLSSPTPIIVVDGQAEHDQSVCVPQIASPHPG